MGTFCEACEKNFSKSSNLRAHAKKFHPEKVSEIAPKKVYKTALAFCGECSKTFTKYANYRRHVAKFHKEKNVAEKQYRFKCVVCKKNFSHLRHFKSHKKTHQPAITTPQEVVSMKKCPLCAYAKFSNSQLIIHFESAHDLPISTEILQFPSFQEFIQWKTEVEKKTSVMFINKAGTRYNSDSGKRIYYRCHRSGVFKSKGKGIRRIKSQGTSKINGYCPSELKLTIAKSGECTLIWIKTHVGHDADVEHLRLTSGEKYEIASKIASKVPFDSILDNYRYSNTKCELERLHLLTKKDLYNIEQNFNLKNNSVRHHNDVINISNLDVILIDESTTSNKIEELAIIKSVSPRRETVNEERFKVEKEKLRLSLMQALDDICTMEELEVTTKIVAPIQPTLIAMRKQADRNTYNKSTNKYISPQRCFYKTKKTQKE